MKTFEYVEGSHETFPDDQYTKEILYLCFDGKFRVAYVRKPTKSGGMFWSTPSISISRDGSKKHFDSFLQDSTFLDKDIRSFLDARSWEAKPQRQAMNEIPF